MSGTTLERRHNAAVMLAKGDMTLAEAAHALKLHTRTLERWNRDPAFLAEVEREAERIRNAIRAEGIANRQNRIDRLDADWRRMQAVIEARGEALAGLTAGGETGLLVQTIRYLPGGGRVEEFAVDTGLLSELRATEKQAAQELQQWTEKREVAGTFKSEHTEKVLHDFDVDAYNRAYLQLVHLARLASGATQSPALLNGPQQSVDSPEATD